MRPELKRIMKYDKDLPFEEFAEIVGPFTKGYNINYVSKIFTKKFGREPNLSEKIDFDKACLMIEDIDYLQSGPLIIPTILKKGKLLSRKNLSQNFINIIKY